MLFDESNNICNNTTQIANLLQKQFSSVFSNPSETDLSAAEFNRPEVAFPFGDDKLSFSRQDIINAIDDIKLNSAAGPDAIPVCLLKNCKELLSEPIYLIWERSFEEGDIPSYYKTSYIAPLHKKGSRALPVNYRPVSLTSHIIKIFERVLRKKLVCHLESNSLLCSQQHGFRSGHSCLTQLLHHFDDILEDHMNGEDTDAIYLDYAKAFDKVDHKLLIKKLHRYQVHPKMVKWIEEFLSNRTQHVVVEGVMSYAASIISGVPQGTVLGPVLFLIFINDITDCITKSTIRCFADDTRIMKSIGCEQDVIVLQEDLDKVVQWSKKNNMTLHEDKFELICHNSSKSNLLKELPFTCLQFQYKTSQGNILTPKHQLTDLGVKVCDDLSWSHHITSICDKARQTAAWVFSVFHSRGTVVMLTLYKSLVRSQLEYCSPLWNPVKIADIQELEGVQRTFTNRIAGCHHLDYWERLKKLSLMSLQRRRERYIIIHMWKLLHGLTSNDLKVHFYQRSRFGTLATVPSMCKGSSMSHQSNYDSSFGVVGPKLWNAIPYHLNEISTLALFKSKLTRFLLTVPDRPPVKGYTCLNSNSLLSWRTDSSASALWGGREL